MTPDRLPEDPKAQARIGLRRLENRGELPSSKFFAFKGTTLIAHGRNVDPEELLKMSGRIVRESPKPDPDTVIVIELK